MAVIKQAQRGGVLQAPAVIDLSDFRRQGRDIVEKSQREAAGLIAEAHEDVRHVVETAADRGHAEGWSRGFEEGLRRGQDQAMAQSLEECRLQIAALESGWTRALAEWQATRRRLFDDARDDVLEFALAVARKVIHRTIEADSSCVIDQIRAALALVNRRSALSIAINPADRAVVERALPAIVEASKTSADVVILDRGEVSRGGCIVNTAGGAIDAGIEIQMERIIEALLPSRGPEDDAPPDDSREGR